MKEPLSTKQIARRLGIAHLSVQLIERRALAKLAVALGETRHVAKQKRCSGCGELGHQRGTCQ